MVPPPSSQDPVPCPAHITSASLHSSKALRSGLPAKRAMSNSTETSVTEFILLGFPELCHVQGLLFGSFLTIYMVTILENLVVMATIRASRQLHTPMYFFLANLSVLETLYTSVTIPKLLAGLLASARTISFSGCLTQLFLFLSLGPRLRALDFVQTISQEL